MAHRACTSKSDSAPHGPWQRQRGSGLEYELYNIKNDPGQMSNLLYGKSTRDIEQEWARLHKILTDRLVVSANLPDDFGWPLQPARA